MELGKGNIDKYNSHFYVHQGDSQYMIKQRSVTMDTNSVYKFSQSTIISSFDSSPLRPVPRHFHFFQFYSLHFVPFFPPSFNSEFVALAGKKTHVSMESFLREVDWNLASSFL